MKLLLDESQQYENKTYIQSIRDESMRYGIIKIKPPSEWNPIFNLSFDYFKFSTKIQLLHHCFWFIWIRNENIY